MNRELRRYSGMFARKTDRRNSSPMFLYEETFQGAIQLKTGILSDVGLAGNNGLRVSRIISAIGVAVNYLWREGPSINTLLTGQSA